MALLSCTHDHTHRVRAPDRLPSATLVAPTGQRGYRELTFTAGEPCPYPDCPGIVRVVE